MAASYVEQAILRVVDQSSKPIAKINKSLAQLFSTAKKGRNLKIDIAGLEKTTKEVTALSKALARLPKTKTISIMIAQGGKSGAQQAKNIGAQLDKLKGDNVMVPVTMPGLTKALADMRALNTLIKAVNRKRVSGDMVAAGGRLGRIPPRSATSPLDGNDFSDVFGRALTLAVAYAVITAGTVTVKSASKAAIEGQAEETKREIIVNDPKTQASLENIAKQAAGSTSRLDLTRLEAIALDSYSGGLRGKNLESLVPVIAQKESTSLLLGADAGAAKRLSGLANRILNLANATDDLKRSQDILSGVYAGAIVQGESFNAPTTLAALRTSGISNTITGEGLVGISGVIDSLGQRAGSSLARLMKEMFTPLDQAGEGAGISKGAVERLIAFGIRGNEGVSKEQASKILADPAKFVQEDIREIVEKNGLNVDRDRAEVQRLLLKSGFNVTSSRLVLELLSSISESEKARALAKNIANPDQVEAAARDDLGAALKDLGASFRTFSSEFLDPIFKRATPAVLKFSEILESLALDDGPTGQLKRLGFVAGIAATAIAGLVAVGRVVSIFTPLGAASSRLSSAGGLLQVAARALTASAAAQRGVGVPDVDGNGGSQKGGKKGSAPKTGGSPKGFRVGALLLGLTRFTSIAMAAGGGAARYDSAESIAFIDKRKRAASNAIKNEILAAQKASMDALRIASLKTPSMVQAETLQAQVVKLQAETSGLRGIMNSMIPGVKGALRDELAVALAQLNAPRNAVNPAHPEGATGFSSIGEEIAQIAQVDQARKDGFAQGAETLRLTFGNSTVAMQQTFATGAMQLNEVGGTIGVAASQFGPVAGQGLLAYAGQFGAQMAAAFSSAVGPITVNTRVQAETPRLDTGYALP